MAIDSRAVALSFRVMVETVAVEESAGLKLLAGEADFRSMTT